MAHCLPKGRAQGGQAVQTHRPFPKVTTPWTFPKGRGGRGRVVTNPWPFPKEKAGGGKAVMTLWHFPKGRPRGG